MDLSEIRKLLELMDASKLIEFEYEDETRKIRLKRADERPVNSFPVIAPSVVAPHPAPVPAAAPAAPGEKRPDNIVEIKSPLVGTFYRAPKPDVDSFVNVGDDVQPEKVMCIIEAMKVMNEIKAEMHGVVREILVKNGQAVEYGEILFLVEKK